MHTRLYGTTDPALDTAPLNSSHLRKYQLLPLEETFAHQLHGYAYRVENIYATTPMPTVTIISSQDDEEALYASFEQAISDRLTLVQAQLDHLSTSQLKYRQEQEAPYTSRSCQNTAQKSAVLAHSQTTTRQRPFTFLGRRQLQRIITYSSLALLCMLIGFDLLAIFILSMQ